MVRSPLMPWLAAATVLVLAACSRSAAEEPAVGTARSVDELRALGYSGVTAEASADRSGGVVAADPARIAPGYNLTSVSKFCTADLFDERGELAHRWHVETERAWDHVELLADGDLLVVGSERGERKYAGALCEDHYLERLAFDGTARWKLPLRAHHDVQATWSGDFMTLTADQRKLPALDPDHDVIDNRLTLVSPDGRVLEERSLYDLCSKAGSPFRFQKVAPNPNKQFPIVDCFHANSIEFVRDPALFGRHPIFAPHNVLLSLRHQDSLVVVDWDRGELIWQWGQGELSGPHDARILPNGHILVFDNGMARGWTRVVEVDPASGSIVWSYSDPVDRSKFFSASQGSSQRLANGNTLIGDSNSGRAFEVTADGRTVWDYRVPHFDDSGHRAEIYRIRRYPREYVERILAEHAPTPREPERSETTVSTR
jgi:hypothetical protein